MTANSYLVNLANRAIIRDSEKDSISRSISTLESRLWSYFGTQISDQFKFGSYTRGTILPRCMDSGSDIDYMVVFADARFRPQTYLDKLRRFVETKYARSEIAQSHPTIVLYLNHIRFELVPAVRTWLGTLQIPGPASSFQSWIETDPNGFNSQLSEVNQRHRWLVKPLIRLVKYWNVLADKPWVSYELEKWIAGLPFYGQLAGETRLSSYVYELFEDMNSGWNLPLWKRNAIEQAKGLAEEAKKKELFYGDDAGAERDLRRLFPDPAC